MDSSLKYGGQKRLSKMEASNKKETNEDKLLVIAPRQTKPFGYDFKYY
jgi:hypothetical protein